MRFNNRNDFLTVAQVSDILKLSVLTIYKYIKAQKLEAIEFGGHYRIEKSSLQKFINDHRVQNKVRKSYEK